MDLTFWMKENSMNGTVWKCALAHFKTSLLYYQIVCVDTHGMSLKMQVCALAGKSLLLCSGVSSFSFERVIGLSDNAKMSTHFCFYLHHFLRTMLKHSPS